MNKALTDFLFGLCFGMGFTIAYAVISLLARLLSSAAPAPGMLH
jgi:hypothetical protein